jgi:hypothetical protein
MSEYNTTLFTALLNASNVYFNYTGQAPCTNLSDTDGTGNLDGFGWNVLSCNQLAMTDSNDDTSMFLSQPFNSTAFTGNIFNFYIILYRAMPSLIQFDSSIQLRFRLLRRFEP